MRFDIKVGDTITTGTKEKLEVEGCFYPDMLEKVANKNFKVTDITITCDIAFYCVEGLDIKLVDSDIILVNGKKPEVI